jgi:hypothetical protein
VIELPPVVQLPPIVDTPVTGLPPVVELPPIVDLPPVVELPPIVDTPVLELLPVVELPRIIDAPAIEPIPVTELPLVIDLQPAAVERPALRGTLAVVKQPVASPRAGTAASLTGQVLSAAMSPVNAAGAVLQTFDAPRAVATFIVATTALAAAAALYAGGASQTNSQHTQVHTFAFDAILDRFFHAFSLLTRKVLGVELSASLLAYAPETPPA